MQFLAPASSVCRQQFVGVMVDLLDVTNSGIIYTHGKLHVDITLFIVQLSWRPKVWSIKSGGYEQTRDLGIHFRARLCWGNSDLHCKR